MMVGAALAANSGFGSALLRGWSSPSPATAAGLRAEKPGKSTGNPGGGTGGSTGANGELTPGQHAEVEQLKAIDRKVRAHEQAHMAAGGELVRGGATYTYQTGPDKKRYAVAGEVSIDTSAGRTPEETIPKAERIRQAALAPADPSSQDRQVAAFASRMEMQARMELAHKAAEARAGAGSARGGQAVGAYQAAGGLEKSSGFSVRA